RRPDVAACPHRRAHAARLLRASWGPTHMTTTMGTLTPQQINGADLVDFVRVANEHSLIWETAQLTDWSKFQAVCEATELFNWRTINALHPVFRDLAGVSVARQFSGC